MTDASTTTGGIQRDVMQYDVVIVGAGPAGLACAIRLKQLKPAINVCVLEKAAAIGAHSLSGAVLEPGPLMELLPEWAAEYPGMKVPALEDDFRVLTRASSFRPVPDLLVKLLPAAMTYSTPFNNHGNFIVSLGQLTAWLAQKAEGLGIEVFAGFAAAAALFDAGRECGADANMAKLLASEATWHAAEATMATYGGFAYAREYDIERKWREIRLYQTAPISTNLILAYIGQHVLGMPRSY